jgi:RNA methyltransferase, TrmH family
MTERICIRSRDNPLIKDLRRLSQDNTAYRKHGRVWLEGDHLCRAALARGWLPEVLVLSESLGAAPVGEWQEAAKRLVRVSDDLWPEISVLESPARMGFVLALPHQPAIQPEAATVVLDRVQDAGNVGSILRSAAAFGFTQVLALKGTAALWSPKVLRAGMGAHFGLQLLEGMTLEDLDHLRLPWVATSSHQGRWLHEQHLPWPCAWLLGHEGQGVCAELSARAQHSVRIAQPGGEESLNVAAAAAICLHASAVTRLSRL